MHWLHYGGDTVQCIAVRVIRGDTALAACGVIRVRVWSMREAVLTMWRGGVVAAKGIYGTVWCLRGMVYGRRDTYAAGACGT
jgi:hypothetical protein